jgi:nitroreductase
VYKLEFHLFEDPVLNIKLLRGSIMEIKDNYDIIFKRKSIRNYDSNPLDNETLKNINSMIKNLKPLIEGIETDIRIISSDDVKTRIMKKAPHYIVVFSEEKEGYLTNVGYMLQQMDLILSAHGIGTCWQGIPTPNKDIIKSSKLKFVILMAFGTPNEPLHRQDVSEFKRKPLEKITDMEDCREILEAVRLAPSATNSQPWFLSGDRNSINVYSIKPNFLKALVVKKYIPIDIGILIYHLQVITEHLGKNPEIVFKDGLDKKGYIYHATFNLNSKSGK